MTAERVPVSDRKLELFAVGELPPEEAADLERRLGEEPELAARLEALRASDRDILSLHPPGAVAAEVRRRVRAGARAPGRARRWSPLLWLGAPALVAAIALVVNPVGTDQQDAGERVKGGAAHLVAVRVQGLQAEPLADGARAAQGDVVQLAYVSAGFDFGVILSIDGRGKVTLHWPEDPSQPARLTPGGPVGLPHAFQLDDAPEFERFFLVAAREPISVTRVLDAARAAGREAAAGHRNLDLPASWIQSTLQLRKESH